MMSFEASGAEGAKAAARIARWNAITKICTTATWLAFAAFIFHTCMVTP